MQSTPLFKFFRLLPVNEIYLKCFFYTANIPNEDDFYIVEIQENQNEKLHLVMVAKNNNWVIQQEKECLPVGLEQKLSEQIQKYLSGRLREE